MKIEFDIPAESATEALAGALARLCDKGDVIALSGDLGTGKTVFARAFIRALGGSGEVPSPTFTLLQTYELPAVDVYHFDLYRLEKPDDALELGIDDAFADGVSLIEWPAKLGSYLPRVHLAVKFEHLSSSGTASGKGQSADDTRRRIDLEGNENWTDRLGRLTRLAGEIEGG